MKKCRIAGVLVLIVAVACLVAGVLGGIMRSGSGFMKDVLTEAEAVQARLVADDKLEKAAQSVDKKAGSAISAVDGAVKTAGEAMDAIDAMDENLASGSTGVELIDQLYETVTRARKGVDGATSAAQVLEDSGKQLLGEGGTLSSAVGGIRSSLETAGEAMTDIDVLLGAQVLGLYQAQYDDAFEAVSKAEASLTGVEDELKNIVGQCGIDYAPEAVDAVERVEAESAPAYADAARALLERAEGMQARAAAAKDAAAEAVAYVAVMEDSDTYTPQERVTLLLRDYYIGVIFTAVLLGIAGIIMVFFPKQFANAWKKYPAFSTLIALLAMMAVQAYALGFGFKTFGEWGSFWSSNAFNVLRANTSVGMIALGMTMVVITGGIDLAVGSTLAGVGTVVMVLLDTSSRGVLGKFGITGLPAYALGILGGMLTGLAIGAVIGLAVTKGRVPPFIVTLGVMNIVRSVAQYFTKSYSLKIPTEFTGLANTVIQGQRILPILYWLVLAVIIYIVMKHTAFGRHIYAVGSNERTTRLSGINVNAVKMKVYMLMGLIVSIASVTQLARLGNMDVASAGSGYELDAIAAVVVGGTSMSGGKGSVVGTLIGVLIIGIMNNLLILLGVDSFLTNAFKGAIVIFAVLMQRKEREV